MRATTMGRTTVVVADVSRDPWERLLPRVWSKLRSARAALCETTSLPPQRVIVEDVGIRCGMRRVVWLLRGMVKRVIDFGIGFGIDFGAPTERIIRFPDKTVHHDVDMRRRLEGITPPFLRVSSCFVDYSLEVQF